MANKKLTTQEKVERAQEVGTMVLKLFKLYNLQPEDEIIVLSALLEASIICKD